MPNLGTDTPEGVWIWQSEIRRQTNASVPGPSGARQSSWPFVETCHPGRISKVPTWFLEFHWGWSWEGDSRSDMSITQLSPTSNDAIVVSNTHPNWIGIACAHQFPTHNLLLDAVIDTIGEPDMDHWRVGHPRLGLARATCTTLVRTVVIPTRPDLDLPTYRLAAPNPHRLERSDELYPLDFESLVQFPCLGRQGSSQKW